MASDFLSQPALSSAERSLLPVTPGAKKLATSATTERPVSATEETAKSANGQKESTSLAASLSSSQPGRLGEQQENTGNRLLPQNQQPEEQQQVETLSAAELREILDEINSALYSYNRALKFEIHDKTDDLVVRVLNTKTDEVIRQYPSEEILAQRTRLLEGETNFFSTQVS